MSTVPARPERPLPAEVIRRHDEAERLGDDGYIDPATGLFVFTGAFHLARGTCCDSNCRHCPYG